MSNNIIYEPALMPYVYSSLEPYLSEEQVKTHYEQHHRLYYLKLTELLSDIVLEKPLTSAQEILIHSNSLPEEVRQQALFFAGGIWLHEQHWLSLRPHTSSISKPGLLTQAYLKTLVSKVEKLEDLIVESSLLLQGVGWCWLALDLEQERVRLAFTQNHQVIPLDKYVPLAILDLWEHAYYLDYQGDKESYLRAQCKLINWIRVEEQLRLCTRCYL